MISFNVRLATIDDAQGIVNLLIALGHSTSEEQVVTMWSDWEKAGNRAYVAESAAGEVAGVVTIHEMVVLHRPLPVGRITALFVSKEFRNGGMGRALVRLAECYLNDRGCGIIEITSNFQLQDAHAFYEHLGYTKTSYRLAKTIGDK